MTDLNKLRSEFEAIHEIKAHLDHGNVFWSDKNQTYASEFQCLHVAACYVNGAWFMFQKKAKAQAVPEGYCVISNKAANRIIGHIAIAMCHPNNSRNEENIMAADQVVVERAIEASESGAEG